jgi:trk system potassium uptake protein TrkA
MGCGRVGSALALDLEAAGHSVAIIDQSREAFRRLGSDFKGKAISGIGFDRDTLLDAGIERADAFAAVSNGDNSNILAARVARETYGVQNVVARIYDPGRAEIYQRLGIPTVATVLWATDQILRRIIPEGSKSEWRVVLSNSAKCIQFQRGSELPLKILKTSQRLALHLLRDSVKALFQMSTLSIKKAISSM